MLNYKNFRLLLIVVAGFLLSSSIRAYCLNQNEENIQFQVKNTVDFPRNDVLISIELESLGLDLQNFEWHTCFLYADEVEIPSQLISIGDDKNKPAICFVSDFDSGETREFEFRFENRGRHFKNYPRRTQAQLAVKKGGQFITNERGRPEYEGGEFVNIEYLRVPDEHTDHSYYIRFEGPGWESDKVGYRFYLDWRNAVDVFGKKVTKMTLQDVGLDGFQSYHEMDDWGMDILQVGRSLGIGTLGTWIDEKALRVEKTDSVICQIVENGPIYTSIKTDYFGWEIGDKKHDVISELSIHAGSRITKHDVTISGNPDNICTGIVKLKETNYYTKNFPDLGYAYIATYGKQSLSGDNLGLAVIYPLDQILALEEDQHSHVVVLGPKNNMAEYYYLAAWEQEVDGITTEDEFLQYLEQVIAGLGNPLLVEL